MTIKLLQTGPGSKRVYAALITVIVLLLAGLLVGAYGVNKLLGTKADKLIALKAKSQALDQEQLGLAGAKKEVKTYAGLQTIAQTVVPEDKDQAEAVREIVNIAAANNVNLAAINFPASTLGNSAAGATGAVTNTAPTHVTASANSPTAKLSQLVAVKNIPGVYDLQIVVQGDPNKPVQYNSFINFLSALEHNRRTAQISAITLQPATTSPNLLVFTLTLNEYIKP